MTLLSNKKCVPQRYALTNLSFTNFFVENIIIIIIIIVIIIINIIIIIIIIINDLFQFGL